MDTRDYWIETALRIGQPLLDACEAGQLKQRLPQVNPSRTPFSYLEAVARYLSGIAPWLECEQECPVEEAHRQRVLQQAHCAIDGITHPDSLDRAQWAALNGDRQPLVDASFMALAFLRAPTQLWSALDPGVQANVIDCMKQSSAILPHVNNWLLFRGLIEAFFYKVDCAWDATAVDYGLRKHMDWYVGDGHYSDGDDFGCDYYNSFVIHPYLIQILDAFKGVEARWAALRPSVIERAQRYAELQERLISPEGAFPPIGRSLIYRFGAFQSLALAAQRHELPSALCPAQVRCALTAMMRRIMDAPGNFDENGWLNLGFCGSQPELAEPYITVGSQYICSNVFLALGLPASDPFWADADVPWTSQLFYSGAQISKDVSLEKVIACRAG